MLYVERNDQGEIISVRRNTCDSGAETKAGIDNEILQFLGRNSSKDSMFHLLVEMDTDVIRILEDLVDILVNKNIIMFSELPQEAQEKLLCRKQLRKSINNGDIIIEDEDIL